ncbi:MAG: PIG-L family deacetylase [Verrucomicrobia bacterium]|nr:PIG-L family deacetylase [Verrucomicrobiota bacterium]
MNPYQNFVTEYQRLLKEGAAHPLGGFPPSHRSDTKKDALSAMIFSPHPDDECIIGGLPLRLLREARMRVMNVAVTQGSRKDRQTERYRELQNACAFMGYELIQTHPNGLEGISRKGREQNPAGWANSVKVIANILDAQKPEILFFPHDKDWNSTHIGTHDLVVQALESLGSNFQCFTVETEFWGQMPDPNLMVESSSNDVADMVAGTSFHVGEVRRNPFHLFLPAWMQDNVRRGSELVGGQGEAAPDYYFATLYRLRRWAQGQFENVLDQGRQIACADDPRDLFQSMRK